MKPRSCGIRSAASFLSRRFLVLALAAISSPAVPEILFIDLNNAKLEVDACVNAAEPGEVNVLSQSLVPGLKVINARVVDEFLRHKQEEFDSYNREHPDNPRTIDSIHISGHHGPELFFGGASNQNELSFESLAKMIKKYPFLRENKKLFVGEGCYTGHAAACDKQNETAKGLGVTLSVGYPLRAPTKDQASSADLVSIMCSPQTRRDALAAAETCEALYRFYQNITMLGKIGASACNKEGIVSKYYGDKDCHAYDELRARCGEFKIRNKALEEEYDKYLKADRAGYENPPVDGGDDLTGKTETILRQYYNELNLWDVCDGITPTSQAIRLIFFDNVRDNLARANRAQLMDYDSRLRDLAYDPQFRDLHLERYQLGNVDGNWISDGDIAGKSRAYLNQRIKSALGLLEKAAERLHNWSSDNPTNDRYEEYDKVMHYNRFGRPNGGTNPAVVRDMAKFLYNTLVDLNHHTVDRNRRSFRCSHFSLVHAGANPKPSECIRFYSDVDREESGQSGEYQNGRQGQ